MFKPGDYIQISTRYLNKPIDSFFIWQVVGGSNTMHLYRRTWGHHDNRTKTFTYYPAADASGDLMITRKDDYFKIFKKISTKLKLQLALYLTGI